MTENATACRPHALTTDPADYEEDEDYTHRVGLGLRRVAYVANESTKGAHPDQRPCPPWCWVGQHPHYDHEIETDHPLEAQHTYEPRTPIVASKSLGYRHDPHKSNADPVVVAATLESMLQQRGQQAPEIEVYLRSYGPKGERREHHWDERLRLSADDARELALVLNHLVDLTEAGEQG